MTLTDIQGYASLILALIAILAVVYNIWRIPAKVTKLEKKVEQNDQRITLLEKAIIELNQIKQMTKELYDFFLQKGLKSK